ncbi:SGNH/GDSL hydrolase family protein [Nakamurella flavida]|uniref:SGNH/GDSL hydrolase family protein n=1 Tax=Nakamurella flavida TaxID=363630 RepID=A0A938YMZ9_9ACTN|nr:SGNH/GDSL hydrolase family protein [Nakamurella flavida]MBM9476033.1 SGNH/GDSL hydrolase family protein [Nakamurella flavida]MDP9777224.1 lysophospholipase L1-like esterase [Nakamurella flavida]
MSPFRFRVTLVAVAVAVTTVLMIDTWYVVLAPKARIRSEAAAAVLASRLSSAAEMSSAAAEVSADDPTAAVPVVAPAGLVLPSDPAVLVLGDSWAAGWGSDDGRGGYIQEAFDELGWTRTVIDAVGGIGYLNPGDDAGDYQDQFDELGDLSVGDPDLIIVQGSTNDASVEYAGLPDAADTLFDSLQARWPNAQLLMLAGAPEEMPIDPAVLDVNALLGTIAAARGLPIIDPIQEDWITPDNIDDYVDITGHPNDDGHAYLAGLLAADLRALTGG